MPLARHAEILPQARRQLDRHKRLTSGRQGRVPADLKPRVPHSPIALGAVVQPPVRPTGFSSPADNAHSWSPDPRLLPALGLLISVSFACHSAVPAASRQPLRALILHDADVKSALGLPGGVWSVGSRTPQLQLVSR
jgi:hypothetical protein